jgi:adenylate kinase
MSGDKGMNVVLLGPSGAGKSTQGERLAFLLGIPHISTGEMFRAVRLEAGPLARQIRGFMDQGTYVPDQLTNELVLARLDQPDAQQGFILDGYPRTWNQAAALDQALGAEGRRVDFVLFITAPIEVLKQRLGVRLTVEWRTDDTPEIIERRLRAYKQQTHSLVDYYAGQGKLFEIDGAQSISDVSAAVDATLGR